MNIKDEITRRRHNIMSLRARGLSTKPTQWHEREVRLLHDAFTAVTKQRDDLAQHHQRALDYIKFLEDKLKKASNT